MGLCVTKSQTAVSYKKGSENLKIRTLSDHCAKTVPVPHLTTAYCYCVFCTVCSLVTFCIRHSQEICIVATPICLSVCLFLTAFLHYCRDPDVTLGNGMECPFVSCALLGRFAIGARVSLLWQTHIDRC